MKFCTECSSILTPRPIGDKLMFICICGNQYDATPDDTLRMHIIVDASESNQKFDVFVENACYDPAANIVKRNCPKCKRDYMTRIYVGTNATLLYVCECGHKQSEGQ